jgi:hypothetical protein
LGVCTCNKLLEWGYIKVTFFATREICYQQTIDRCPSTSRHWSLHIA